MHKQLISFVQVIKFLENMNLKGGVNPKAPLAYALEHGQIWPPLLLVCVALKNKLSTMLSSNVQSIDLMNCTA